MDIPNIIYQFSRVFTWVSIGLELLAVVVLAVAVFSGDYNTKTSAARDFLSREHGLEIPLYAFWSSSS